MSITSILKVIIGIAIITLVGLLIEELTKWIAWRFKRALWGISTIITPILTSSPELSVYITALTQKLHEIAWGSIIAQPFMASTIIYPVIVMTSIISWIFKRRANPIPIVSRSLTTPLILFSTPLIPFIFFNPSGIFAKTYGMILICTYVLYAIFILKQEGEVIESVKAISLRLKNPIIQALTSVIGLYVGSHLLVGGIEEICSSLNIDEIALTILITPIATVLPESIVGLIFVWKGLDSEGIGVIVGEKALYSTFYLGIALLSGTYAFKYTSLIAIIISIVISLLEALAVYFRRFGLTAPLGLFGYVYYAIHAAKI